MATLTFIPTILSRFDNIVSIVNNNDIRNVAVSAVLTVSTDEGLHKNDGGHHLR